jgi:GNAT superfamily N-acetyltransferase
MELILANDTLIDQFLHLYPGVEPVLCRGANSYTILAYDNDKIAAFVSVFRRQIPAPVMGSMEDFINVIDVINVQHRRKGLGSLLVQKVIEYARNAGSIQVRAYCDINNEASHGLWLKNGFGISPMKMPDGTILGSYVTCRIEQ